MSQTPAQAAASVRKQTLQTITNDLVATNKKINAMKAAGQTGTPLDTLYDQIDQLFTKYEETEALSFNNLNDLENIDTIIADLKTRSRAANEEAARLKKVTDTEDTFTALLDKITGVIGTLTSLAAN